MPKKFILFDCDGVLVDSEFLASHVLAEMLHKYGCPTTAESLMTDHVGQKDIEIVRFLAQIHSLQLPIDFIEQYAIALDAKLIEELKSISGISEMLAKLTLPRAIVSNSNLPRIKTSLKSTGLDIYFTQSKFFSPDNAGFSKPDPRIYQYAIDELGLLKDNVIVVEDSPTGVFAASSSGLDVIGFLGATHLGPSQEDKLLAKGAKYIVHNATELSLLLGSLC
jgi:HAD superfamily hydrolase (TIGR01509 family)